MKSIFKNMLPYWKTIVIVIALLFVQAWCDLSLPAYTSDIIDVGIQNNGVEHVVPESLTEDEFKMAQFIMTEDECKTWESLYTLKDGIYELSEKSEKKLDKVDEQMVLPLIMNYQMSAMEEDTFKGLIAKQMGKDESELADLTVEQIGQMLGTDLKSFQQEKEDDDGNKYEATCVDVRPIFATMLENKMMDKDSILSMRDSMEDTIDTMGSSLVKAMGVAYAVSCDKAAGLDVDHIQKSYLLSAGLKMVGMAFLMGIVTVLVGLFASRVGAGIGMTLRGKVFKQVVGFSNAEMDKFSTASLITRSTNDIQQIQMVSTILLRMVLYAPIIGIGGILKVVNTKTGMGWIIVVAVIAIFVLVGILVVVAMPKFKQMQTLVDRMNLVSREILTGIPVIRAFSREKFEEKRFEKANRDLMQTQLFTNRVMTFMMPMMMLIMNAITIAIVWFGAKGVDLGNLQVGDMIAFITYTMQIVMAFLMLTMVSIMLPRAGVAATRIEEVLDTEPSIHDAEQTKGDEEDFSGVLEFHDVGFAYDGAKEEALSDISFTARPGETTAIIGSTGCGKTTLLNLIPRFYDVTSGSITIDGIDVREMSQEKLRSLIGYVPQKGVLFSGTIASNLKFAGDQVSDEMMKEAADIAQAVDFIEEKEEKYNSPIAQGGTNVSGGQKQRLSIARAIAKNPKIFLFDDSFSALDYKTDVALRKKLNERVKDATVLIVAQRISTILHADKIIVLEEGRIAGIGTHEELLAGCETYQEIASSQLSEAELKGGVR